MKARERLRLIADRLDALAAATIFAGGCMPGDAAALRTMAKRLEALCNSDPNHRVFLREAFLAFDDAPLQKGPR